jgi:glutaredoxin
MLKSWLQHKGLNYREINVDENPEAQAEAFKLSGYSIVPLTIVTQPDGYRSIIAGYNLSALAAIV